MTDIQKKKEAKTEQGVRSLVAGIAGAVAGGIAVGAAIAMSDKKNQQKVKGVLNDAKEKVTKKVGEVAQGVKGKIEMNK